VTLKSLPRTRRRDSVCTCPNPPAIPTAVETSRPICRRRPWPDPPRPGSLALTFPVRNSRPFCASHPATNAPIAYPTSEGKGGLRPASILSPGLVCASLTSLWSIYVHNAAALALNLDRVAISHCGAPDDDVEAGDRPDGPLGDRADEVLPTPLVAIGGLCRSISGRPAEQSTTGRRCRPGLARRPLRAE
jgi:hypothetical protein